MNTTVRFIQPHLEDADRIIWSGWKIVKFLGFHSVIEDAFIVTKHWQSCDTKNLP